jgi:hypothetical protein
MSKLLEARDILVARGLTQRGGLEDPETGCVCALGALNIAYAGDSGADYDTDFDNSPYFPSDPEHQADLEKLARVVRSSVLEDDNYAGIGESNHVVWYFNDSVARDIDDVVGAFDRAAAL